jgi:D-alanyl-D-alanine carboxypeptidase
MKRYTRSQFFFSILTAIIVGVGTAYIGITGVEVALRPPDFFKTFSSHITYAAEDVREEVGDDLSITDSSSAAISALAYSVESLDKGNVLLEKDASKPLPIASVTKLITAVVALNLFRDTDTITITGKMLDTEGDTGHLRLEEKYRISEILYPMLLVSSNDAAEAISQSYDSSHGKGAFVGAMNGWVKSIGALHTSFRDASGLSPQNVSTAHDLSLITKWIKENKPLIFDITLTKAKTIRTHTWINPTHFLNLSSYSGGKNGFIPEARLTNVSIFSLGEPKRLYAVTLLGSQNRDKDTLAVLNQAVK